MTLTAVPQSGHAFGGFFGYCGGSQTCSVPMTVARKVTAKFFRGPFTVRITSGSAGSGSGVVRTQEGLTPAINCTITNGIPATTGCSARYPAYALLSLTATPAAGSSFAGWGPPCTGTGPCEYSVIQGRTIAATFTSTAVRLAVAGSGNGTGSVASQAGLTPAIACSISAGTTVGTGCTGDYPVNTVVTLAATPGPLSLFAGWTGACTGSGVCQVTLAAAATVTAAFTAFAPTPEATEGRWEPTFSTTVIAVHLTLLPTGKVMMWGNAGEAQLWDPATGGFAQVTNPFELFCSGQTLLPNGNLLVAGGHISDGHGLPSAAIFNPWTNTWTLTSSMARGRWYPTLTTLPNGEVLTTGGTDQNGANVLTPEIWNGTSWRQLTGASRALPYYPRMFVAPNGRVFMAGESQATYYLNTGGTGSWSLLGNRVAGSRSYGSAVMYAPGKILYTGGGDPPRQSAEVIDLNQASPSWRSLVEGMAYPRRQTNATLLADGKVLVTHGTSGAGFNNEASGVRDAELWDPVSESWTTVADESFVRVYHSTAILLPDGRVLSSGSGDGAGTTQRYSGQVFTPPYLFAADGSLAPRPTVSAAPSTLSYGQQFTVESPDAANVTRGNLIKLSSATHAMNETQQIYPLTFTHSGGNSLAATAPGNANLATPGPYMLFLLNGNGVPSVARMVLVGP